MKKQLLLLKSGKLKLIKLPIKFYDILPTVGVPINRSDKPGTKL
jgi:hypothetical protein